MPLFDKINFYGGINQQADASRVNADAGEYYLLMNGRTRRNVVRPVRKPLEITEGIPAIGTFQGIYGINSIQVLFVTGQAYWKSYDSADTGWNRIADFQMSTIADRIWLELVPASTVNFRRTMTEADDRKSAIRFGTNVAGSPQCAITMDGETQAWAIFPNATSRVTRTFAEWSVDFPEYVPIAKFPKKIGSKLYCIGADLTGSFNQILSSVSGAPLNFMVPVNSISGDRISNDERESGAYSVAHRADFGDVTSVARINATDGAFFVSTLHNSHLVIPNYEEKIFGEPTYDNRFLFNVGALNQECVVDLLGNTALIHFSGIRDFNGVLNLQNEGRNSPLSQSINDLIADITQTYGATIAYDNFAVFALQTRYGPAIVWYDTLLQKFVSIDVFENVRAEIKQFSTILTRSVRKLFFITSDNRLYEYGAAPQVASARIYIKDFIPSTSNAEHRLVQVKAQFGTARSGGIVQCTAFADERRISTQAAQIDAGTVVDAEFDSVPYSTAPKEQGTSFTFDFKDESDQAWKTGAMLEWNADADLLALSLETAESVAQMTEQNKIENKTQETAQIVLLVGNDGDNATARSELNRRIKLEDLDFVLGLGGHAFPTASHDDFRVKFTPYWGDLRKVSKYFAVPGSNELSNELGEPFYQTLAQSPTRYFLLELEHAVFFMMNSGYDNTDTQIEIDNTDAATLDLSTQFQWLRNHLRHRENDGKFKFVVWSHPPYSSTKPYTALRVPPLQSWGIHALFSANDGVYERLNIEGFPYFICGTGSPLRIASTLPDPAFGSYKLLNQLGYLRATIHPMSTLVEFVSSENGETLDLTVINK